MTRFITLILAGHVLSCATSKPLRPLEAQSFEGMFQTGMMAIGGETTGNVLRLKNGDVIELELPPSIRVADFRAKQVLATGHLKEVAGTEIRQRKILVVESLKPSSEK